MSASTTTAPPPAIAAQGLAKRFGPVAAVRSVDLVVPERSIFGLLGPNGAGKTTTLRMLVGLLQPTGGHANVLDLPLGHPELRHLVGYLPQQPRFYPDLSARETLRFIGRFFYRAGALLERRIDAAIEIAGLEERADRPVGVFSGGERQRLGIAQAQLHEPRLLILDEPAAGLDPLGRRDVLVLLQRLRATTTVVFSTHILDDVQRVSDTVAIIDRGVVARQARLEELLASIEGVAYRLRTRGPTDDVLARVREQAWVRNADLRSTDGVADWVVTALDEEQAEAGLLRLVLADPDVSVLDFGRVRLELEEAFVRVLDERARVLDERPHMPEAGVT